MNLLSQLEAILFVASKPMTMAALAKATGKQRTAVEETVENLVLKYNHADAGIHVLVVDDTVQMGTNPAYAELVSGFIKDEIAGELTKAQLETLTVIAYRGPVTRAELEQIRGVNCAVIIRNLMIRGLIEERADKNSVLPSYILSTEALRQLGISSPTELDDFETLSVHEHIEQHIAQQG